MCVISIGIYIYTAPTVTPDRRLQGFTRNVSDFSTQIDLRSELIIKQEMLGLS